MNTDIDSRTGRSTLLVLLALLLLITGCTPAPETPARNRFSGTIVLWHSLADARAAALATVVDRFESLHPDAAVIIRQLPTEAALLAEFQTAVQSGLGADLILTGSDAVNTLAASGAIRPLDGQVNSQLAAQYLASALTTLRFDGKLYGLPFGLDTQVLYYNNELAPTPPATLEQLAADARSGKTVLVSSRFRDALWGFRAFGASLIDPQTGALTFNQGGFVNWLTWLQQARDTPGFVLDPDQAMLRQAFLDSRGAYYVGRASDLPEIYVAMGDAMGVAPLPTGPNGSAGPLLSTSGFMVNAMSSEAQAELALENFASGIVLTFERSVRPGDVIESQGTRGVVSQVGMRATVLRTADRAEAFVPNKELMTKPLIALTYSDRVARVALNVSVAYGSDIDKVNEILLATITPHPLILADPMPGAALTELAAYSINFLVFGFVADFNDACRVQAELYQMVRNALVQQGIDIPFPRSDMYIVQETRASNDKAT